MDASKHLTGFKESDHDILVKIVRGAQWRKVKGKRGEWKDFVDVVNRKRGGCMSDPGKHPVDVLSAFVKTFTKKKDIELVKNIRKWGQHRESEKLLEQTQPWPKSPEQHLVDVTHAHPRYRAYYNFQSWNEGWTSSSRGDIDSPVRMVSLDCEMVVCEDDQKEVVRVCAVGSDCHTLLDELVLPSKGVKDYLTNITGVSTKDLEGVTVTQADAQKLIMKLLTPGTILVGHSLYHDLRALKIDHKRVIDTSLVFRDSSWPVSYSLSLSNLCKTVLKYDFREEDKPHNCLDDAIIPMRIVQNWIQHGVGTCSLPLRMKEVTQDTVSKLLLHKLPNYITVPQLERLFHNRAPCEIQDIVFKNRAKTGSTVAIFNSMKDADYAFEQLEGVLAMDSYGYPQKSIVLLSTDGLLRSEIQVRKMLNAQSMVVQSEEDSKKRLADNVTLDGEVMVAKRKRSDPTEDSEMDEPQNHLYLARESPEGSLEEGQVQSNEPRSNNKDNCMLDAVTSGGELRARGMTTCSCTHFQELKTTKLELAKVQKESRSRENEIKSLQKLVAALSRRGGPCLMYWQSRLGYHDLDA